MSDNLRLNSWMEENNITTSELAEKLEVSHTAISMMRSGKNNMSVRNMSKFLSIYPDFCPRWLFTGEGTSKCERKAVGNVSIDFAKYLHSMEEVIAAKDEIIGMLKVQIETMTTWRIAPTKAESGDKVLDNTPNHIVG